MKTIYELIYVTNDGQSHNVLFANADKAERYLKLHYFKGAVVDYRIVDRSFVISRVLF